MEERIEEEIDQMDFEDTIAGGLKTRFKYAKVEPNSYGLETDEVLNANAGELNQFVSLRRMSAYQPQEWQSKSKHRIEFRKKLYERMEQQEKDRKERQVQEKKKGSSKATLKKLAKKTKVDVDRLAAYGL